MRHLWKRKKLECQCNGQLKEHTCPLPICSWTLLFILMWFGPASLYQFYFQFDSTQTCVLSIQFGPVLNYCASFHPDLLLGLIHQYLAHQAPLMSLLGLNVEPLPLPLVTNQLSDFQPLPSAFLIHPSDYRDHYLVTLTHQIPCNFHHLGLKHLSKRENESGNFMPGEK